MRMDLSLFSVLCSPSETLALEEVGVLDLEPLAVEHRVVGLLGSRADHVEAAGNLLGLLDLRGGPLRGTPVEGLVVWGGISLLLAVLAGDILSMSQLKARTISSMGVVMSGR